MSSACLDHQGDAHLVGADIYCSRKGYTLTLHRKEGEYPVLAIDSCELQRWHDLDEALAFLIKHFGVTTRIYLKLQDE